jgi:hypothetical protein
LYEAKSARNSECGTKNLTELLHVALSFLRSMYFLMAKKLPAIMEVKGSKPY